MAALGDLKKQRRVVVFTGDGKGKTTAALGVALRAAGRGLRVFVLQFMKADATVGEVGVLRKFAGIEVAQMGLGFVPAMRHPRFAEHVAAAKAALERAKEALSSDAYDLVVLDEVCTAISKGLLCEAGVARVVEEGSPAIHLILTGRGAGDRLIALADTVTEMRCVKHGFNQGIDATEGIEF